MEKSNKPMKSLTVWFNEYAQSHRNKTNKIIHYFCIPFIVLSIVGLLWSFPNPISIKGFSLLNVPIIISLVVLIYYFSLAPKLSFLALIFLGLFNGISYYIKQTLGVTLLWQLSLILFIISWAFQFIGHKIEGKRPSFLKDLQFLLIGPLWCLDALSKKFLKF